MTLFMLINGLAFSILYAHKVLAYDTLYAYKYQQQMEF